MKTAVAYYSLGGTTRSYARAEAKARNADLIELTPKTPYNRFTAFVRGCLEAVKQKAVALDGMPLFVGYDRVVLMAPVWAGYPAPVFNSAVELLPPGTEVAEMLFVPLVDFAAAQEQGASLTGLTPDGRTMEMPNESLCCLHTEEWQGAKPRIEALFD